MFEARLQHEDGIRSQSQFLNPAFVSFFDNFCLGSRSARVSRGCYRPEILRLMSGNLPAMLTICILSSFKLPYKLYRIIHFNLNQPRF